MPPPNVRQDEYGGSLENRIPFLSKWSRRSLSELDAQRVGVKISPMHEGSAFQANDETLPIDRICHSEAEHLPFSHLLLMGNTPDFTGTTPLENWPMMACSGISVLSTRHAYRECEDGP